MRTLKIRWRSAILLGAVAGAAAAHILIHPPWRPVDFKLDKTYAIEITHQGTTKYYQGTLAADQAIQIDGDSVPDVMIRAGHANVNGVFGNNTGNITAPVFTISRHPVAIEKKVPSPPARIVLRFTINVDMIPKINAALGYDTRVSGASIPTHFSAVLGGLDTGFDPMRIVVDTTAPFSVTSAEAAATAATSGGVGRPTYEGPLTLVASIRDGNKLTDLNLQYQPLPPRIDVAYDEPETSADPAVIVYSHSKNRAINAASGIDIRTYVASCTVPTETIRSCADPAAGQPSLELRGAIDRLPSSMEVNLRTDNDPLQASPRYSAGDIKVLIPSPQRPPLGSAVDGRPPDLRIEATVRGGNEATRLNAALQDIPGTMTGDWYFPNRPICSSIVRSNPCAMDLSFSSSGTGVGKADLALATFTGTNPFPIYVSDREQFVNVQTRASGTSGQAFVSAHVNSLRKLDMSEIPNPYDPQSRIGYNLDAELGDGTQDIAYQLDLDARQSSSPADRIRVTGVVTHLPKTLHIDFTQNDLVTPPIVAHWKASQPVQVSYDVTVQRAGAAQTAKCGDQGVTCVVGQVQHLPNELTVRYDDDVTNGTTTRAEVEVDSVRQTPDKPALTASITTREIGAKRPQVVRLESVDLPDTLRARVDADGSAKELRRVRLLTCPVIYQHASTACSSGNTTPMGRLRFSMRNHVVRPAGFPIERPAPGPSLTYVARPGSDGENDTMILGEVEGLESLDYWSGPVVKGVSAVITHPQNGPDLRVKIDSAGVEDPNAPNDGKVDLATNLRVITPPRTLELCFRPGGRPITAPNGPAFVAECEVKQPFTGATLSTTPVSFHYSADSNFGLDIDLMRRAAKTSSTSDDDEITRARLSIGTLPKKLTAHIAANGGSDPLQVMYRLPAGTGFWTSNANFAVESLVGDAFCLDPREGRSATCVKGSVNGLPEGFDVVFDGENRVTTPCGSNLNICAVTSGGAGTLKVKDFEYSKVAPNQTNPAKSDVVVINTTERQPAYELPIAVPGSLSGTFELPTAQQPDREVLFDIAANPALSELDLSVRTFMGADPLPQTPPGRDPDQSLTPDLMVIQRGDAMKARLHVLGLTRVRFSPVRADPQSSGYDPKKPFLPTRTVKVEFAGNPITTRIFADLVPSPSGGSSLAPDQILADIYLANLPTGVELCLRGPRPDSDQRKPLSTATTTEATWCDDSDGDRSDIDPTVTDDDAEGAFQFASNSGQSFDVDALVRLVTGGGQQLVNARFGIKGIPGVVRGTFPATNEDEAALDLGGFLLPLSAADLVKPGNTFLVAAPIGTIDAQIATFDHDGTGYPSNQKLYASRNTGVPIDGARPSGQHVQLRLADGSIHARLKLGGPAIGLTGGQTTARSLQRLFFTQPKNSAACKGFLPNGGTPGDFPVYPTLTGEDRYTCLRALFNNPQGGTTAPIEVSIRDDVHDLGLSEAGLTTIPEWFSVVLSPANSTPASSGGFLPRCSSTQGSPCVPPMLRLDQPDANAKVFGVLSVGPQDRIAAISQLSRPSKVKLPGMLNTPLPGNFLGSGNGDIWGFDWLGSGRITDGIRPIVALAGKNNSPPTAVRAGFRLPVPQSLTVDQVQTWEAKVGDDSSDDVVQSQSDVFKANHIRFHYVVKDGNGKVVGQLGQLSALLGSAANDQIVLAGTNPAFTEGIAIPGELDLDVHLRNDAKIKKMLLQADVTIPASIDARVHILPVKAGSELVDVPLDATVNNVPSASAGYPSGDPTFRLRFATIGKQPFNQTPGAPCNSEEFCPVEEGELDGQKLTAAEINDLSLVLDLDPTRNESDPAKKRPPARLVEGLVRTEIAANGVELAAFRHVRAPLGSVNPSTPVELKGSIEIRPLNVSTTRTGELKWSKGKAQMFLRSYLTAFLPATRTTQFALRQNIAHVRIDNSVLEVADPAAPTQDLGAKDMTVGPVVWTVSNLHFEYRNSDSGFRVNVGGAHLKNAPPPKNLLFAWRECNPNAADPTTADSKIPVPAHSSARRALWPFDIEPNLDYNTIATGLLKGELRRVYLSVMCGFPIDNMALIHKTPSNGARTTDPGDPLKGRPAIATQIAGHEVPDAQATQSDAARSNQNTSGAPTYEVKLGETRPLCGTHVYKKLTVSGTLKVSNQAITTDNTNTGRIDCPLADAGWLFIIADEVSVPGHIDANSIVKPTNATGNGGGGHGGAGGMGAPISPPTNPPLGWPGGQSDYLNDIDDMRARVGPGGGGGSAGSGGMGGGAIHIYARKVVIGGKLTANGDSGWNQALLDPNDCKTSSRGNIGLSGGGGGAGGGIVIAAAEVTGGGAVEAKGGAGGQGNGGGGGGGGGGAVMIVSPLYKMAEPAVDGGDKGVSDCSETKTATPGGAGVVLGDRNPRAQLEQLPGGWFKSVQGRKIGFSAGARGDLDQSGQETVNRFRVWLCGVHIDPLSDPSTLTGIIQQSGWQIASICGNKGTVLGNVLVNGTDLTIYDQQNNTPTFTLNNMDTPGYWGLWTVAVKSTDPNVDCGPSLTPACQKYIERDPSGPEVVFGIEMNAPTINPTKPAQNSDLYTKDLTGKLVFEIDAQDPIVGQGLRQSGIARIECKIDNDPRGDLGCQNGQSAIGLPSEGSHVLRLKAFDGAGNESGQRVVNIHWDYTPPKHFAPAFSPAAPQSGWYSSPPTIKLEAFEIPPGVGPATSGKTFAYRFDAGPEKSCSNYPCLVTPPTTLTPGRHRIYYAALDKAGNGGKLPPHDPNVACTTQTCAEFAIDMEKPVVSIQISPEKPNSNGYHTHQPLISIAAVDQPGASGPGAISYGYASGQTTTPYANPVSAQSGKTQVCAVAKDVAGNTSGEDCPNLPTKIDLQPPTLTTSLSPSPSGGWFRNSVIPSFGVADPDDANPATAFSSTQQAAADACAAERALPANPVPAGVCVSIDGSGFVPVVANQPLPSNVTNALAKAGRHTLRSFAIDRAGRRSSVVEQMVDIDLKDPILTTRSIVGAPAVNNLFRLPIRVVAVANDGYESSGPVSTTYNNGTVYDRSILLKNGQHTLAFSTVDQAGRIATMSSSYGIDTGPPSVAAVNETPNSTRLVHTFDFTAGGAIRAAVLILDGDGLLVARVDGTENTAGWQATWTGSALAKGCLSYRVVGTDTAGNVAQSDDSARFVHGIGLCTTVLDIAARPTLLGTAVWPTNPWEISVFDDSLGGVL